MIVVGSCIHSIRTADLSSKFKIDTIVTTDTLIMYDTVYLPEKTKYFYSFDDIILFVAYLKTQSNQFDEDNWTVIHTLFNRLDKHNVGWREYFNRPTINNSRTIRRIIDGKIKSYVNLYDNRDQRLIQRVIDAYLGYNPTRCPKNILYFESHKHSPNRGVFLKSNIWKEYRHKFYYDYDTYKLQTGDTTSIRDSTIYSIKKRS